MHQRKSKKILVYFFLLILLGSINNITLSELNYMKINHIKVSGLNNRENNELLKKLQELDLGNIFLLNKEKITTIIDRNTKIENYKVQKKYPSTLDVEIKKTNFLAKLNYNDSIYVIGNNGRLSKNTYEANGLPFIFGKPNAVRTFLIFPILAYGIIIYGVVSGLFPIYSLIVLLAKPFLILAILHLKDLEKSEKILISSMTNTLYFSRIAGALFIISFLIGF